MPAILNNSIKVLIVEERNALIERIADLLSREHNITNVTQITSYTDLQTTLMETVPDLVLGDYFEFKKFCDETKIPIRELCPEAHILLYSDEDGQSKRIEVGCLGEQRVFDVRNIQHELRSYLKTRNSEKKVKQVEKR